MKVAKLKNGAQLRFPDGTSDEVIQSTVRRVLNIEEKKDDEEILKPVLDAVKAQDVETETIKSQVKKLKVENEKLLKSTQKANKRPLFIDYSKLINNIFNIFRNDNKEKAEETNKITKESVDKLCKDINEVGKTVSALSIAVEKAALLAHTSHQEYIKVTRAAVLAQNNNTEVLKELVKATKAPRKIVRDKQGKPESIK